MKMSAFCMAWMKLGLISVGDDRISLSAKTRRLSFGFVCECAWEASRYSSLLNDSNPVTRTTFGTSSSSPICINIDVSRSVRSWIFDERKMDDLVLVLGLSDHCSPLLRSLVGSDSHRGCRKGFGLNVKANDAAIRHNKDRIFADTRLIIILSLAISTV